MPTKVKGMTSIEIAILVATVLAIAIAAGWYLYTTFAAAAGSQPVLRVVSAIAYGNGTIRVEVLNVGSAAVHITKAEVFGKIYPFRNNAWYWVPPSGETVIFIDTGQGMRAGSIIQGKLITSDGQSLPFTARVVTPLADAPVDLPPPPLPEPPRRPRPPPREP